MLHRSRWAPCRLANRLLTRPLGRTAASLASSKTSSVHELLANPTWSVRSLRAPEPSVADQDAEPVTVAQLHHLLRLAALPLPKSKQDEEAMIATLHSQLRFVRAVQRVNTEGVEPLSAIRDETDEGVKERTIGLADLRHALDEETLVGHYKRPRRVKEKLRSEAEMWDVLATASKKAGKYFVVGSGPKENGAS
ncbi:hypothetical protein CDD83_10716 [Cordyceps sp. RAO-2017]|nr:hypothetical protein CDD83_10716 [Cordyceps sp. RAO-2017]